MERFLKAATPRSHVRRHMKFLVGSASLLVGVFGAARSSATTVITQMGSNINAEADWDYSGSAVDMSGDGTTVIVGAMNNSVNGTNFGHARVFRWINNSWAQLGNDIDGANGGDKAGSAVAISSNGNRVAVGSPRHSSSRGQVRIFDWNAATTSWDIVGTSIVGTTNGEEFGKSVDISSSGHRIIVGQPEGAIGLIRAYEWSGSSWIQMGNDIVGPSGVGRFGNEVAMSSDGGVIAAITAPFQSSPIEEFNRGNVQVFRWSGTAWEQVGADIRGELSTLIANGDVALSADGLSVAVGFPRQERVRTYTWNGSSWQQRGTELVGSNDDGYYGFKIEFAKNGDRIAIGGPWNSNSSGRVRVFDWDNASSAWVETVNPIAGDVVSTRGDELGHGIGMSSDGTRVAIGAPNNNGGHVRVYSLQSPQPDPEPDEQTSGNNPSSATTTTVASVVSSNSDSQASLSQSETAPREKSLPAAGSKTQNPLWIALTVIGFALLTISRRQKSPRC